METPSDKTPGWFLEVRERGLYKALLLQLKKDYERANLQFFLRLGEGEELVSPGELLQGLRESLYVLQMERFDQYLNLMYAADVPERQFRSLSAKDPVDAATEVAWMLLWREWQKVSLRSRFGSSPD
jgi:hypothetical protein